MVLRTMANAYVLSLLYLFSFNYVLCYEVPPAKIEAIYPKGLRVSIPGLFYIFLYIRD